MNTKQVFHNAKWIIVCKIAQSVMQLIIGMICARYLGPSNYGLISYAGSIVAFALPLMKLGLDAILVHELVESPEKEGEIMGTSMVLNILSGLFCILGVSAFSVIVNFGETEIILVCVLYSISVFFAALEMMQYWFQYKLLSKYSSIVMLIGYLFVSAYKIFLLVSAKNVYWFAISHSVEYGVVGFLLILLYCKKSQHKFSFSWNRAKKMISKSKYYIFAAMMIVIIQNTDHIMLTAMIGTVENGYYAAAITTAGIVQFIYVAIIDSFRPMILSFKKEDGVQYEKSICRLYGLISYLSIAQSIVFTVFAPLLIGLLYGDAYIAAIPVLQILVWYMVFSFMGSIRNIWLLAEGKQKYLPFINLSGVVFNIALNFVMIPMWGACGAALASLLTQFFINFVLGFIMKPLRVNNRLLIKGLNPTFFAHEIRTVIRQVRKKE